jgi:hypothetical protein
MAANPVFFKSFGRIFREKKTYGYVAPLKRLVDNVTGALVPGLNLPITGVKSRFNVTAKKFALTFTGKVGLAGLGSSLPTFPPALGGGTLSSVYLSGKIVLKGKSIVNRKKPLVAKDFKTKRLSGKLAVQVNGKKGPLLLGLENVKVPFTSQVRLNRQIIADPLATSGLIPTGGVQLTPTGPLAPLVSGLLSGGGGLMLPVV